jgi:hypothetical protein
VPLVGAAGTLARLAAKIDEDGILDTVDVKSFAEKTLKTKKLIDTQAFCGMLGEARSSCEAPSAGDVDVPTVAAKPCCFEWLVNGVKVEHVPAKWKKPLGALSISVVFPAEAGFDAGLSRFLQELPIDPSKRKQMASTFWSKGMTKESQLAGIIAHDISEKLHLPPVVADMLEQKEYELRGKNEGLYSTLQIIRGNGLFRGVRIMDNIEDTMLGPVVRLSPNMANRNNDQLSFAVAFAPDSQSSEVIIEGTSAPGFESLNKAIQTAGFSAASSVVKNLGFGVSISGGLDLGSRPLAGKLSNRLPTNGKAFHKSVYFYEPHVLIDIEPTMLEPTESFHEALDSVLSGSVSVQRMFELYGTHTCPRALLGGWMRYTGTYRSTQPESTVAMANRVTSAIQSYRAAKAAAEKTGSAEQEQESPSGVVGNSTNASESVNASTPSLIEAPPGDLNVLQDWKGGAGTSEIAAWRASLQAKLNANWRVIDRYQDECIPHWYWVGDNPNLAHSLCHTYASMRDKYFKPYVLEHPGVTCSESTLSHANESNHTRHTNLTSVQPSLQACAEHVFAKHGKAYFIYGKAAEVAPTKAAPNATNASNCIVLKTLDNCAPASNTSSGEWALYEARGNFSSKICGEPPPGYKHLDTKAICPSGQYQVKNGYPGSGCVPCFTGCGTGFYTKGCGGASPGSCVKCEPRCPTGSYRVDCGGLSPGSCRACPTPSGPFSRFVSSIVPCKFECYAPAQPQGQSCVLPRIGQIAEKNNSKLLFGKCDVHQWENIVLTEEAHCGNDYSPFSFDLDWLGSGNSNKGEWHINIQSHTAGSSASPHSKAAVRLAIVENTLVFDSKNHVSNKFSFEETGHRTYKIIVSKTGDCIKVQRKPMFQVSSTCCDEFVFVD